MEGNLGNSDGYLCICMYVKIQVVCVHSQLSAGAQVAWVSTHEYLWAENFNCFSGNQWSEYPVGAVLVPLRNKDNAIWLAGKIAARHFTVKYDSVDSKSCKIKKKYIKTTDKNHNSDFLEIIQTFFTDIEPSKEIKLNNWTSHTKNALLAY